MADYGFMVSMNFRQAHLQEVGLAEFRETVIFLVFFQQDRFQYRLHGRFQDRCQEKQTPPSNSLK